MTIFEALNSTLELPSDFFLLHKQVNFSFDLNRLSWLLSPMTESLLTNTKKEHEMDVGIPWESRREDWIGKGLSIFQKKNEH